MSHYIAIITEILPLRNFDNKINNEYWLNGIIKWRNNETLAWDNWRRNEISLQLEIRAKRRGTSTDRKRLPIGSGRPGRFMVNYRSRSSHVAGIETLSITRSKRETRIVQRTTRTVAEEEWGGGGLRGFSDDAHPRWTSTDLLALASSALRSSRFYGTILTMTRDWG